MAVLFRITVSWHVTPTTGRLPTCRRNVLPASCFRTLEDEGDTFFRNVGYHLVTPHHIPKMWKPQVLRYKKTNWMENIWQCFGLAYSLLLQDIKVQIKFGDLNYTYLLSKGACNFGNILYHVISAAWLATVFRISRYLLCVPL